MVYEIHSSNRSLQSLMSQREFLIIIRSNDGYWDLLSVNTKDSYLVWLLISTSLYTNENLNYFFFADQRFLQVQRAFR